MKRISSLFLALMIMVVSLLPGQAFAEVTSNCDPSLYTFNTNNRPPDDRIRTKQAEWGITYCLYMRINDVGSVFFFDRPFKTRYKNNNLQVYLDSGYTGGTRAFLTASLSGGNPDGSGGTISPPITRFTSPDSSDKTDYYNIVGETTNHVILDPASPEGLIEVASSSQIIYRYALDSPPGSMEILKIRSTGYLQVAAYVNPKDGDDPFYDSKDETGGPLDEYATITIDLSDYLRGNKHLFTNSGWYILEFQGWTRADYGTDQSTDGWKARFWYDANANGPGTPYDPDAPTPPAPPSGSWDIIGWLKYIGEWLLYLTDSLGFILGKFGTSVGDVFNASAGMVTTIQQFFSWMPPEILTVMAVGILSGIILRVFAR